MPSAPTSRDFKDGREEDELVWCMADVGWVQLPSPTEARMEDKDFGKSVIAWSRVIVSAVNGTVAPSAGRASIEPMRRRWSSRSSGRVAFAVSRIGFTASAKGSLSSAVLELRRWETFVTISMISYARKQSVIKFDLICMFSSRRVFANSAKALRQVTSRAMLQSS